MKSNHEITNAKQSNGFAAITLDHMTVSVLETRGGDWVYLAQAHGVPFEPTAIADSTHWPSRETAAEIAAGVVGFQLS